MKKLMSTLMAALFLTGVSFAQMPEQVQAGAEGNKPNPQMFKQNFKKMKKGFEEIAKEINLSDEQKQQIEAMAKADKDKKKEIRKQIREKFKAIDTELLKENYDVNVINGLTAEIQSMQGEMAKMNIDSKIQMRSILTYDQFKQVEQIRQDKKNKIKEMKENIKVSTETAKEIVATSTETAKAEIKKAEETVKDAKIAKAEKKAEKKAAKKAKRSKNKKK